jgi:hypothetical protein
MASTKVFDSSANNPKWPYWLLGGVIAFHLGVIYWFSQKTVEPPRSLEMIQEIQVDLEAQQRALEASMERVQREVKAVAETVTEQVEQISDDKLADELNAELESFWSR